MKVALIGYGKMGKEIEQILRAKGHQISIIIDKNDASLFKTDAFTASDVAIEFTQPNAAVKNYNQCFHANIPVVSGTTGWLAQQEEVLRNMQDMDGALFYASNFSIGVNLFFSINQKLAQWMNSHPQYDVSIEEIHHTEKKDSPSGTAIHAANDIVEQLQRKKSWSENVKNSEDDLIIYTQRKKDVPGIHSVLYHSDEDQIELSHTAYSRKGFAKGAVAAAEWVIGRKGFFTMKDMLPL